ncbi:MAG: 4Fe-4S dicluster domain-containing protein [Anaerolineae bacterium]
MPFQERKALRLGPQEISPTVEALRETVAACMQCGTCSGSCPSAPHMDYTPRQVMLLLQLGLEEEAIRSQAIWVCANCYLCTVRCPRDIPVSEVMGALRTLNLQRRLADRRDRAFVESFLGIVRRYGRMSEPELLVRYYLQNNPLNLLARAGLALAMLRRGKIELLPHRVKGVDQVRRLYQVREGEGG